MVRKYNTRSDFARQVQGGEHSPYDLFAKASRAFLESKLKRTGTIVPRSCDTNGHVIRIAPLPDVSERGCGFGELFDVIWQKYSVNLAFNIMQRSYTPRVQCCLIKIHCADAFEKF